MGAEDVVGLRSVLLEPTCVLVDAHLCTSFLLLYCGDAYVAPGLEHKWVGVIVIGLYLS